MTIVIFSPDLSGTTGSPIRAYNIISGIKKRAEYTVVIVSSGFKKNLSKEFRCYSINDYGGIENAVKHAAQENNADLILCITHGYANTVYKASRFLRIPLFVDIHGIRSLEILEEKITLAEKIKKIRECFPWFYGVLKSKKVFCANPMLYAWLKILLRNKAVDVCGIANVRSFKSVDNNRSYIKIAYAGNFNSYQGVDLFVDAIKIIGDNPAMKFYIVGNNSSIEARLSQRIGELRTYSNFTFSPPIDYKQYPKFLSDMDVFVIPRKPSLTAYMAFPQKIVESMSAGKCTVATNLPPHQYALRNPTCGILCDPNAISLADAIMKTRDNKLRRELGDKARQKALDDFDLTVQIPKIIKYFES